MADQPWALTYKQLQANFVSNLNGTSLIEISLLASTAPLVVLLRSCIGALLFGNMASFSFLSSSFVFILDFTVLILPLILVSTILSNWILTTLICLVVMVIICLILTCCMASTDDITYEPKRQPFICNYRAYIIIATVISILAVDFNIFPRRFAKAETFGSGFMDVGVGSFIISNAIVSPEARTIENKNKSKFSSTIKAIKSSLPLLVLGLARFVAVKSTDYQEHVSEYGVHWNFFMTLFIVKVLSTVIVQLPVVGKSSTYGITGVILAVVYQYSLTNCGLENYVINGTNGVRNGFLDANREGFSSCLGYLALYFMGLHIGRIVFTYTRLNSFLMLLFLDIIFWILTICCRCYISPVSRRMANITFVFWQMAYNVQFLVSFLLVDLIAMATLPTNTRPAGCDVCYRNPTEKTSDKCVCLVAAVNRNQLAYFLVANLLTGVINIAVKTLYCSSRESLWIICSYMFVISSLFSVLHVLTITLRIH